MNTPVKWNSSNSREVGALGSRKWEEVRSGLTLAVGGAFGLLVLGAAGAAFLSPMGRPLVAYLGLSDEGAALVGQGLVGLAVALCYLLVLMGQWRCMNHAPQGHGAKELMFAGLLSTLVAPTLLLVVHFVIGYETYGAFHTGPGGLANFDVLRPGGVLQVGSVVLLLVSFLLFAAFARAVNRYLRDEKRAAGVTTYFWFVAFLIGATGGLLLHGRQALQRDVVIALVAGWVCFLLWHTLLLHGTARCVSKVLRQPRGTSAPPPKTPGTPAPGQVVLSVQSYFQK